MPTSSHSETDAHNHPNSFGDLAFGGHSHSQRPSMSFSQSGRGFSHGLEQLSRDDIQGKFAGLTLGDGPGASSNGLGAYGNGANQTQFNPQSQSWGPAAQGYGVDYQKDLYHPNPVAFEKRGSIPDRGSPAGSTYQRALSSPKSFTGTPQPGAEAWSRPTSRDPRNGPDLERRGLASQQFQHQHQVASAFFSPQQYYGYQPYPAQLYNFPANFRHGVPVGTGYDLPMHQYIQNTPPLRPAKDQDPARGMRSQLLDDFRATQKPNKRYELKHIYDHIVEFSGDQHGSRFIQEKLESANSDEKDQVFREIEPNALQLMRDVFGNYVIQKFFEHGNQVQKKVLASAMKGKVIDLSLQMYACRVVQKALEHVLVEQQAELVKELEADILRVVKDQNGNHVVQKIVELVPRQHLDFIMNCLKGRVSELSSHTYGCRVVQRILEHGSEADKAAIMQELHQCAHMLITDQYGNYVTQHVIAHGKPGDSSKIIDIVTGELLVFSKHKFASNVVEKCIECGTPEELSRIREGLSEPGDELNSPMPLMIKDQYGNYVIQKLLSQLSGSEREAYVEVIRPHVIMLRKANTSQRQVAAIERLITLPTPTSTAATQSPTLPADEGSALPTPGLTTGHNSPSSSPPSTNDGLLGEVPGVTVEHASAKLSDTTSIH
ncbi:armadillo-type protein [Cercophora newfieldiana]|uniref:Pumilio homology domain family member 3 n=1 Tax=Cercophora newfieldiana TaxID=92897 RepID=A0AA39Y577_9PEZI|nr:armadillo-type protein [Cercophora newfieldiana]